MDWKLNKEQIEEVAAMYTELCEEISDEEVSLHLHVSKNCTKNGKVLFTYDVYAIFKGKLIYINMGDYRSLMDSNVTNFEAKEIIDLLKGNE